MSLEVTKVGDNLYRAPGTCNQTGNSAPKYPWSSKANPIGRFARIAALCCAYRLGYNDERMGKLHEIPRADDLLILFIRLVPWFPDHYNEIRKAKAEASGYDGPMEEFNAADLENRVRYCFAEPGRRGHDPKARVYGISVEHPDAVPQKKKGGRGEVWTRCSEEIGRRLVLSLEVTKEEAEEWGR